MKFPRASLLPFALLALVSPTLNAQDFERIDVDNQGQPGNAGGVQGDISQEGRIVVFISYATNFGGPDVVSTSDVFVRDRQLGTTTRITSSVTALHPFHTLAPRISGDGATIAFMRGLHNPQTDPFHAFVCVLATGVVTEVLLPNLVDLRIDGLNRDGNFAVLIARTTPSSPLQVYRLHIPSGGLVLCSRDPSGNPVGGTSGDIDDDGTHVSFCSDSAQVVPGDTNGASDAFVYDIPGNVMIRASVGANGVQHNGPGVIGTSLNGEGRYVAFTSHATNLVVGDTNARQDVFVRDLRLGVTAMVSLSSTQAPLPTGASPGAIISGDGASVVFVCQQSIQPNDSPAILNSFLRDIDVGTLLPASTGSPVPLQNSTALGITRDGREVLIQSMQLPLGVSSSSSGIFVAKFGPRCSSSGYCTSLPNSTGQSASIGAQGDASLQLNTLVISAVGLPATANALVVSGSAAVDPGAPFGNGLLCIGGGMIRHGVHVANGGVILDAQDVHAAEYLGVHPGDTRYYQVVYRDPSAGGALFNTTDAVAVTFCW